MWCDRCEIGRDTANTREASRRSGERFIIAPTCRSTLPPSVTIGGLLYTLPPSLDIAALLLHSALLTSPIARSPPCSLERFVLVFPSFLHYEKFLFLTIVSLPPFFPFLLLLSPPPAPSLFLLEGESDIIGILIRIFIFVSHRRLCKHANVT